MWTKESQESREASYAHILQSWRGSALVTSMQRKPTAMKITLLDVWHRPLQTQHRHKRARKGPWVHMMSHPPHPGIHQADSRFRWPRENLLQHFYLLLFIPFFSSNDNFSHIFNLWPNCSMSWRNLSQHTMEIYVHMFTVQNRQQSRSKCPSVSGWIEKMWCVHTIE